MEGLATASKLLCDCKDVFRVNLNSDPPANVELSEVRLKQGYLPLQSTQRSYDPPKTAFIFAAIRKLGPVGAPFPNPKLQWASPALSWASQSLAVSKPGTEKFRFTVDLRAPIAITEPIASAMPNLESLFKTIRGGTVFANIDLFHAYWQIPLHPESQECMPTQTLLGVYTPGEFCKVVLMPVIIYKLALRKYFKNSLILYYSG